MPVKVVSVVSVKPGREGALVAAARECVAAPRAEPGVLRYDLWKVEAERRFIFDELYLDDAAVHAHMAFEHFKVSGMAARDLATARPSISVELAG
jgi:quinol monooxygenase YgiN